MLGQVPAVSGIFKTISPGGFPGLGLCQPQCAAVPNLSPALQCPSSCDRALLAPDGGESHDALLCVVCCGSAAEISISSWFMDFWWHSGVAES